MFGSLGIVHIQSINAIVRRADVSPSLKAVDWYIQCMLAASERSSTAPTEAHQAGLALHSR